MTIWYTFFFCWKLENVQYILALYKRRMQNLHNVTPFHSLPRCDWNIVERTEMVEQTAVDDKTQ